MSSGVRVAACPTGTPPGSGAVAAARRLRSPRAPTACTFFAPREVYVNRRHRLPDNTGWRRGGSQFAEVSRAGFTVAPRRRHLEYDESEGNLATHHEGRLHPRSMVRCQTWEWKQIAEAGMSAGGGTGGGAGFVRRRDEESKSALRRRFHGALATERLPARTTASRRVVPIIAEHGGRGMASCRCRRSVVPRS